MRYAQIKGGNKLHMVFEAGEGWSSDKLTPAGHVRGIIYLTISNALQWRLQYSRVIAQAGAVDGIIRVR